MWEKHQSEWMGIIPFYKGLNRVIKFIYGGPNIIYFFAKASLWYDNRSKLAVIKVNFCCCESTTEQCFALDH
jgi:hypothetical protein